MTDRRSFILASVATIVTPAFGLPGPTDTGRETSKVSALDKVQVTRLRVLVSDALKNIYLDFLEGAHLNQVDEVTQAQLRTSVDAYLADLKGRRVLYDFKSVCDAANNPPRFVETGYPQLDVWWVTPLHLSTGVYEQFSIGPRGVKERV